MVVKRYDDLLDKIYSQTEKVQITAGTNKKRSIIDSLKLEKNVVDFMKIQVKINFFRCVKYISEIA